MVDLIDTHELIASDCLSDINHRISYQQKRRKPSFLVECNFLVKQQKMIQEHNYLIVEKQENKSLVLEVKDIVRQIKKHDEIVRPPSVDTSSGFFIDKREESQLSRFINSMTSESINANTNISKPKVLTPIVESDSKYVARDQKTLLSRIRELPFHRHCNNSERPKSLLKGPSSRSGSRKKTKKGIGLYERNRSLYLEMHDRLKKIDKESSGRNILGQFNFLRFPLTT